MTKPKMCLIRSGGSHLARDHLRGFLPMESRMWQNRAGGKMHSWSYSGGFWDSVGMPSHTGKRQSISTKNSRFSLSRFSYLKCAMFQYLILSMNGFCSSFPWAIDHYWTKDMSWQTGNTISACQKQGSPTSLRLPYWTLMLYSLEVFDIFITYSGK